MTIHKVVAAAIASATLLGAVATTATPAAAWGRGGWGGPFAAGLIGGVAAGAILGAGRPVYGGYNGYGYAYAPAYPAYPADTACYWSRTPVYDAGGSFIGQRPMQVCN